MAIVNVTDASFEADVLRSEIPVLVDLWAEWCGPCKQMAPALEQIAKQLEGKVKVAKVDVDANPRVAASFRVQSIPMLVVVDRGQIAGHHVGALDAKGILKLLEPFIPAEASELKPAELAKLIQQRQVVPVDLRDERSFSRARIPGAIHVPADEAMRRAAELAPVDGRLRVLYGRSDADSKELAKQLGDAGVEVGFLAGGLLHWESDGFEVDKD